MKKYIVFLASFALFYGLFQIISGLILTVFHTPNLTLMNSSLGQEVVFGQPGEYFLFMMLFIATLAYFFTQKMITLKPKRVYIKK